MTNPNLHSLIGPNTTVLIGLFLEFWLVVMEPLWLVSRDVQFQLDKMGLSPICQKRCQESHSRNTVQKADSSACSFSLKSSMCERPLSATAARLELQICSQLTPRSPSWKICSFSRSTSWSEWQLTWMSSLCKHSSSKTLQICVLDWYSLHFESFPKNCPPNTNIPIHSTKWWSGNSMLMSYSANSSKSVSWQGGQQKY